MGGQKIKNIADGADDNDAVNKEQIHEIIKGFYIIRKKNSIL